MSAIFILIAASLIVALGFLVAFIWSVKSGQYDDDYTPSVRMLFDDKLPSKTNSKDNSIKNKDHYGTGKI
jgi:cbb3-type cytochrome oxidase maturation protein